MIRPYQNSDLTQLQRLESLIWNSTNSPLNSQEQAKSASSYTPDNTLVAVNEHHQVQGFIEYHPVAPFASAQSTWELAIGVNPAFQHQQIGSQLIDYLKQLAINADIHKITLRVLATNSKAIKFYQKHGFKIEGRLVDEFFINSQWITDYRMAWLVTR